MSSYESQDTTSTAASTNETNAPEQVAVGEPVEDTASNDGANALNMHIITLPPFHVAFDALILSVAGFTGPTSSTVIFDEPENEEEIGGTIEELPVPNDDATNTSSDHNARRRKGLGATTYVAHSR